MSWPFGKKDEKKKGRDTGEDEVDPFETGVDQFPNFEESGKFDDEATVEEPKREVTKPNNGGAPKADAPASSQKIEKPTPTQITCVVTTLAYGIRGAELGAGFGVVFGVMEVFQSGTWREPALGARVVAARSFGNALNFGGYLGAYHGAKCSIGVARGVDDIFNSGFAGAVAGTLSTIRTRNPAVIAGSAFVGAGMMMVIDGLS